VDSWDGQMVKFSERYGDPQKGIYGYVALIGPPVNFPDSGMPAEGQAVWKLSQCLKGNNVATYTKEALDDLIG
jgi:hypothetical protein